MNKTLNWSQENYIRAYHFAAKAHRGQLYPGTGLPYLIHLSFVSMEIIAALAVEEVAHPDLAVQCALLHDVIEDTKIGYQKINEFFGKEVADGVDALSKKKEIEKSQRLHESLKRIQGQPREVGMVKLADRISNLQPPPFDWAQAKIEAYWRSSKEIYAAIKDASPYLGERLLKKIENYSANYIK
jgi:(p)ppGpp synthase/HD superfamily hydrolase